MNQIRSKRNSEAKKGFCDECGKIKMIRPYTIIVKPMQLCKMCRKSYVMALIK